MNDDIIDMSLPAMDEEAATNHDTQYEIPLADNATTDSPTTAATTVPNSEVPSVNKGNETDNINARIYQTASNMASIIKVIGVGGGGGNAVDNMYRENIGDVRYLICNTDSKALAKSIVPNKLQIGPGLGAGGVAERGRKLAEEHIEEIRNIFDEDTQMVFITAGMGGGTGTGVAPIIAREAMAKGILTIGIVTIPFKHEMNFRIDQALDGVEEMSKSVDALLIINNERLRQIYADFTLKEAFKKADDTLTKAVRSIIEIIEMGSERSNNLDFSDVDTCLRNGNVAILSSGRASGESRVFRAIEDALDSPLLNEKEVEYSRALRMAIFVSPNEDETVVMREFDEVSAFMSKFVKNVDVKIGWAEDPTLTDEEVKVTILASGFRIDEEEEQELTPEEQELQLKRELRRQRAYGADSKMRIRQNRVYILNCEDLDNDELVANLDATSVYRRTENDLKNLRSLSYQQQKQSLEAEDHH